MPIRCSSGNLEVPLCSQLQAPHHHNALAGMTPGSSSCQHGHSDGVRIFGSPILFTLRRAVAANCSLDMKRLQPQYDSGHSLNSHHSEDDLGSPRILIHAGVGTLVIHPVGDNIPVSWSIENATTLSESWLATISSPPEGVNYKAARTCSLRLFMPHIRQSPRTFINPIDHDAVIAPV